MLKESIPTASASTASSTVLRMTTSPLSSRPDSSTLIGTNESNPNSMSWTLFIFGSSRLTEAAFFDWVILFPVTNTPGGVLLHMQVPAKQDLAAHMGRLIDEAVPGRRGLEAWGALLDAHAPAPNRSREQDRPGLERLRRDLSIGAGRRRAADDGARRSCVLVTVGPDAPPRQARRRGTGRSDHCRRRCTWGLG